MKKLVLQTFVLIFLLSLNAFAQQKDKGSFFAGYAFSRMDVDGLFERVGIPERPGGLNFHGFNASVEVPLAHTSATDTLQLAIDVGGYFSTSNRLEETVKIYTAAAGPQFTNRSHDVLQPFVRALFGVSHITETGEHDTGFAMLFGGGLDAQVGEKVAVRIVQLDYMGLRHDEVRIDNFRFATGIVILF
jgi:hypothetical protein